MLPYRNMSVPHNTAHNQIVEVNLNIGNWRLLRIRLNGKITTLEVFQQKRGNIRVSFTLKPKFCIPLLFLPHTIYISSFFTKSPQLLYTMSKKCKSHCVKCPCSSWFSRDRFMNRSLLMSYKIRCGMPISQAFPHQNTKFLTICGNILISQRQNIYRSRKAIDQALTGRKRRRRGEMCQRKITKWTGCLSLSTILILIVLSFFVGEYNFYPSCLVIIMLKITLFYCVMG